MKIQSLAGSWEFRQIGTQDWLPAQIPGGVHTDLLAAGCIPDPFVGDNEKRVQWVAESDWEYTLRFSVDTQVYQQDRVYLVCDGLDTLATVYLNGREIGNTNNMFRQYRWDVKSLLATGQNHLRIVFDSPVKFCTAQQAARPMLGVQQAIPGGPHLRKAPCQFGWDWGPQLPPVGIWKDIRLEGFSSVRIADVSLTQQHTDGAVNLEARVILDVSHHSPCTATLSLIAPNGERFATSAIITMGEASSLNLTVTNPQLWWPNGYGAQPLYGVTIEVLQDDIVLDKRNYQLGLRTIELRQQPDQWGRSFTFVVNGISIFAKGSNWIPADSFPTRISDAYLESLISGAADSHQNMLRVWGGGFYEEERFYDLCDRYGILVWQDFIFSCSTYPLDDPEFLENVRIEVVENIRRLRHRTSLALWCGNNEMEMGWVSWGWQKQNIEDLKAAYDHFFHHTLPAWCQAEDPERPYWPSSPSSDTPFIEPNGQQQGDAHYWDVWHGRQPFTAYRDQYPRFMSEFGFQALPPLDTIRTYADEADWNMTSYIMEMHQKNASGNALMVGQMLDTFRLPKDFAALVYLSMALQAEGIRYGVEHWRRFPQRVAGTLIWQLNDTWPVASWSSLDYFGRWKALHYAARRFYTPVLLSIEDQPPVQNVYITNDTLAAWHGQVRWTLETLAGDVLASGAAEAAVPAQSAVRICGLDFADHVTDNNARDTVFIAELWQADQMIARQVATFDPIKHLNLSDPAIHAQLEPDGAQVTISLEARSLAFLVEVALDSTDVIFSDNYFNLPANRPVTIRFPMPTGWSLQQVQDALRIYSVYDSYAHSAAG